MAEEVHLGDDVSGVLTGRAGAGRAGIIASMSEVPIIETTVVDIQALTDHVRANPPDGPIRLTVGENGSLLSQWTSAGRLISIGEVTTRPLPTDLG